MKEKIITKNQWRIIITGFIIVLAGFVLRYGNKSQDPSTFKYKEVYSPRRITVAPILMTAGYTLIAIGIVWKNRYSQ